MEELAGVMEQDGSGLSVDGEIPFWASSRIANPLQKGRK
jgi:hypothetical protein